MTTGFTDVRRARTRTVEERDRGASLVEILISIVLLGVSVTSIIAALQVTTTASALDRDHAISFSWLQAASDEVYRIQRIPCTSGQAAAISAYDIATKAAPRPPRWASTGATIAVTNVEYLGKVDADSPFEWDASFCFEGAGYLDSPLYTQRVTITSTSPDGLVKTLQMVKNEG